LIKSIVIKLQMTTLDFASMYKNAKSSSRKKEKVDSKREISLVPVLNGARSPLLLGDESLLFYRSIFTDEQAMHLSSVIKSLTNGWNFANGREVMLFGGVPHPNGAILEMFPSWLEQISVSLAPLCGGIAPNQVLLNRYSIGEGIAPHQDGPLYESVAAIISLESSAMIHFERGAAPVSDGNASETNTFTTASPGPEDAGISVFLPASSLFVFKDKYYECCSHCVPARTSDVVSSSCINPAECNVELNQEITRSPFRYSLTFRIVKSVATKLEEFGPSSGEMREEMARRKSWWLQSISES
jgi:hypothetical protein